MRVEIVDEPGTYSRCPRCGRHSVCQPTNNVEAYCLNGCRLGSPAPSNPAGTYLFGEPERRLLKWLRRVFGRKS